MYKNSKIYFIFRTTTKKNAVNAINCFDDFYFIGKILFY